MRGPREGGSASATRFDAQSLLRKDQVVEALRVSLLHFYIVLKGGCLQSAPSQPTFGGPKLNAARVFLIKPILNFSFFFNQLKIKSEKKPNTQQCGCGIHISTLSSTLSPSAA